MDMDYLKGCSLDRLEELYLQKGEVSVPRSGSYKATHLKRLENAGANNIFNLTAQWLMFDLTPFGLNFYPDFGDWFFFHPALALGKFTSSPGKSRWRETETIRLNYRISRLPTGISSILYDEIKTLSENILLGIGGVNAEKGQGDHFFFAIERI